MFDFRKSAAAIVAAASLGGLLGVAPAEAQTLKVVMHSDVKILDPIWTTAYIQRNHGYMVWDTLFAMDEKFDVKPQMVDKYSVSADNLTWTFTLRDGLEWHDGKPVTADDYTFGYEMMRSKDIKGPWFNNYYTTEVVAVEKIDDHTILVKAGSRKARLDLLNTTELWPQPKHYYKMGPNWVKQYNWAVVPTTGPYVMSEVKKGKSITFSKQQNWWAQNDRYNQHRFNIDRIKVQVIRDHNIAFRHFLKGEIDTFEMILPNWWHEKAVTPEYKKGYVQKVMAMTDTKQGGQGVHLNVANPKLAPYGAAATEALQALGQLERLTPRFVQGENIAQTLQFVSTGNAELGFVALSQVAVPGQPVSGSQWVVPEHLYTPIRQDAVLLKKGEGQPAAEALMRFMRSPQARQIIQTWGYGLAPAR